MVEAYNAPGRALRADRIRFDDNSFDVAEAFLALMFQTVPARRKLLTHLRQQRPGGQSSSLTSWRTRWLSGYGTGKIALGVQGGSGGGARSSGEKRAGLSGRQRLLYPGELGVDAVEAFRFGDFTEWFIEG